MGSQAVAEMMRQQAGLSQPGMGPSYPGYGQLLQQVLAGIQGVGQGMQGEIDRTYEQQRTKGIGNIISQMASSGLGNSTVGASMRGEMEQNLLHDKTLAGKELNSKMAELMSGYTSAIGTQGLQAQGQYQQQQMGYGQQLALQQQQEQYNHPMAGYFQQLNQGGMGWHKSGFGQGFFA